MNIELNVGSRELKSRSRELRVAESQNLTFLLNVAVVESSGGCLGRFGYQLLRTSQLLMHQVARSYRRTHMCNLAERFLARLKGEGGL